MKISKQLPDLPYHKNALTPILAEESWKLKTDLSNDLFNEGKFENSLNVYEKMGNSEEGEKMLKRVIYFLLLQSNNMALNTSKIHSELKRAILNYTEFASRNGIEIKNTEKVFQDIQEQFEEYETI